MRSFTTRGFRDAYALPPHKTREQARKANKLFEENPSHPSLNLKKVDEENNIYSAPVGLGYRALGKLDGSDIVWYWIGPHGEYDKKV